MPGCPGRIRTWISRVGAGLDVKRRAVGGPWNFTLGMASSRWQFLAIVNDISLYFVVKGSWRHSRSTVRNTAGTAPTSSPGTPRSGPKAARKRPERGP